ncbi:helix-turn-helix domain-containing protein [Leptospira brenneri]|uniref:helix-turn-helix domain-containing protein n=1 Tax=Leptospira brenneri TaxID=2023182 RepID=UPI0013FD5D34|nr:helix-turn-helix transcriptional regulator [Leptospira brenneri]
MKDLDTPGKRLRWFIKVVLHITQLEVATEVGLTQATISNYMNDSREMDIAFLSKLRQRFQLNPTWIINGEGDPKLPSESEIQDSLSEFDKLRSLNFQMQSDEALTDVIKSAQELAKADRAGLELVRDLAKRLLTK